MIQSFIFKHIHQLCLRKLIVSMNVISGVVFITTDEKGDKHSKSGVLYLCTVPMSSSCASLTGRVSTSRAPSCYAEAPQTHCICSVWSRQSIQFSTICWACTYALQKGHRQLGLPSKNSNDTVRNHHDCCHHPRHPMRPESQNVFKTWNPTNQVGAVSADSCNDV